MTNTNQEPDFIKGLSLFDATMIVAGSMIGSGIFIVSSAIANQVVTPFLLIAVWLLAGILTIIGSLAFAELAAALPEAGGIYVFLKEAWNKCFGFAYGWTSLLVIQTGSVAAVAMATAKFTGVLFPWISSNTYLFPSIPFLTTEQFLAISTIIILTMINCTGIKTGALIQNILTVSKVLALIGVVIIGLYVYTSANHSADVIAAVSDPSSPKFDFIMGVFSAISIASVGALFSADAWYGVTFIAAEVDNPKRNLPLSLILGVVLVCGLYVIVNFSYLATLGIEGIKTAPDERVATAAMNSVFGFYGQIIMAVVIIVSTLGCINGMIIAGARVFWAMAKDKLFFKSIGKISPKYHTPVNSLLLQGFWACVLCLSGKYGEILDYVICAVLIFNILTIWGIFRLRKSKPEMERPYKTIGYPYLPIIFIIISALIIVNLLIYKPLYCWPGMLIVLSSVPVYFLWNFINKKKESLIEIKGR